MEVILLESAAYYRLRQDMMDYVKLEFLKLREELIDSSKPSNDWLTPAEARKQLKVGKTKFHELKNSGQIRFAQHGRKILYSQKSIVEFVKKNSY